VIARPLERSIEYSGFAITVYSDGPHAISNCLPKPILPLDEIVTRFQ
jgi:hypothetical protein